MLRLIQGAAAAGGVRSKPDLAQFICRYKSTQSSHEVSLAQGRLVVNGHPIAKPRYRAGEVTWSEKTATRATSGALHAMAGGAMLAGVITEGADEASAKPFFVQMALVPLSFNTEVKCTDQPNEVVAWVPGPPLTVSVTFEGGLPVVNAQIDGVDIGAAALPPPDGTYDARLDVAILPGQDFDGSFAGKTYPLPIQSDILVVLDASSFSGTMRTSLTTAPFPWRGTATSAPQPLAMAAPEAVAALDLSLADLMSLTTTGATDISRAQFNDFTVLGMQDTWRDGLFGLTTPALDPECQALYSQYASLFTDHASDAIILHQLGNLPSDQGGPSNPISDSDKLKVEYFFTRGIMGVDGYTDVSAHLTQIGWERANPRIRDYVNDTTQSWGQQLYNALTTPQALTTAVLAYLGGGSDLSQINRHTDMLLALSPDADQTLPPGNGQTTGTAATYSSLYHSKIISALGLSASEQTNFPSSPDGQSELTDYIAQWLTQMMTDVAHGLEDPNLPAATKAMYSEIQIELTEANQTPAGMRNLANEIITGISAAPGVSSSPTGLLGKVQNWAATSKLATGVIKAVKVAVVGYSLYTVISAFSGWSSLSDKEKAQTVINSAELPIDMLALVADSDLPQTFSKIFGYFRADPAATDVVERGLAYDVDDEELYFFNPDMRQVAAAMDNELSEEAVTFASLFGKDAGFLKSFGVLVALATVGFSSYQIYEDKDSSDAVKAIDSLQLVANVAIFVGALAADTVLACLGPIGIVAGIVLAIVSLFIGKPKPHKPSDDYMDQRGTPYLAALPNPDPNWTPPTPPQTAGA